MRIHKERKVNLNINILLMMALLFISLSFLNANKTSIIHSKEVKQNYDNKVFKEIPEIIKKQIDKVKIVKKVVQRSIDKGEDFIITAYDLSKDCTGKTPRDKGYGITSRGIDIRDKSWKEARVVAVDPNVIKYESKLYIRFIEKEYQKFNGIYVAGDSGSGVNGNHLDFYLGDFHSIRASKEAKLFGIRKAHVIIIK